MPTTSADRVAKIFVEVADTLVDGFDVVDFLYRLTERATELSSVTATGLLLADLSGRLHFMAASDERMELLELFQLQSDEGPCRDCFTTGQPVIENDLTSATSRWPSFVPRATGAGFTSVHAFPLRLRRDVIGSMGLFSESTDPFHPALAPILQALADVATIALLQERSIRRSEIVTGQLQGTLNQRIIIEQAKGAIASRYDITVDQALTLLRTYVRTNDLQLTETARTIVIDPANAPDLTASTHPNQPVPPNSAPSRP
jgi:transcriptional regulator with GAF, ATPase, and Fis domain